MRRPLTGPVNRMIVLIHGWTGDEYSMDLFSRGLPENTLQLFPRGPFQAPTGYGWAPEDAGTFPPMNVFEPTCRNLMAEIEIRLIDLDLANSPLSLVGFSQGGAAVYTISTLYPDRVERAAALASFLPDVDDEANLNLLKGKPFFIAHGARDDTIPVTYARHSAGKLKRAGALVEYCEADVGHKLSAGCMKRLADFFNQ
jgi:phospholipase/carboxylesterase